MSENPKENVPMVAGLAYIERVRALPERFSATLRAEPDNRYNLKAIAVIAPSGEKIGYVAPEVAWDLYELVVARGEKDGVPCPARRLAGAERYNTGVEALLDLTQL